MACQIVSIYVGTPENDKKYSVSAGLTVKKVLQDCGISPKGGTITHNGRVLSGSELDKTLESLVVGNNDTIYSVQKMSSAK